MRTTEQLAGFIHDGLQQGHAPEALGTALREAGWSAREIDRALGAWVVPGPGMAALPVPVPGPSISAREAVVYGLLFLAFGNVLWSVGHLGWLIIDRAIADPADIYAPSADGIRWSIASLVVFGPLFAWLNWREIRPRRHDTGRGRSWVRNWLASITVILASLTLLGDLVTVIYALLAGELTARFAAKALWLALLAGVALAYMRDEVDDR